MISSGIIEKKERKGLCNNTYRVENRLNSNEEEKKVSSFLYWTIEEQEVLMSFLHLLEGKKSILNFEFVYNQDKS